MALPLLPEGPSTNLLRLVVAPFIIGRSEMSICRGLPLMRSTILMPNGDGESHGTTKPVGVTLKTKILKPIREAFGSFMAISQKIFTCGADCYVSLRMTTLVRLNSKYAPFLSGVSNIIKNGIRIGSFPYSNAIYLFSIIYFHENTQIFLFESYFFVFLQRKGLSSVQARTILGSSTRQIPMAYNLGFREKPLQDSKQIPDPGILFRSQRVLRFAFLIQTALVADTYRAAVVGAGMGTNLQQKTVLRATAVLPHIKVVADVTETACQMVASQLFHRIIPVASRGRTMQHEILYRLWRHHISPVLHSGEESPLIADHLPTNRHRKLIFSHKQKSGD